MSGEGRSYADGSKYKCRVGDYVYYDDFKITSDFKAKYNGITHDASANFSDTLSEAIAPFSVKDKKDFSPKYLSGFYADSEDVSGDVYKSESNEIANEQASKELAKDSTYSRYHAKPQVNVDYKDVKLGLFPVYFLSTKNKRGDRISYAVVNGQTGKVAAEIPIDFKKYLIVSLLLAVGLFFLFNGFLTLTPTKIIVVSIVFNIISLIISNSQMNKVIAREKMLDDKGKNSKMGSTNNEPKTTKKIKSTTNSSSTTALIIFAIMFGIFPFVFSLGKIGVFIAVISVFAGSGIYALVKNIKNGKQKQYKVKMSEKFSKIVKPLIGLIIALVIFIWNPVSDLYYYGGAIASIIMTIWSFADLVKEINLLTTRKLPQLGRRGGDENA